MKNVTQQIRKPTSTQTELTLIDIFLIGNKILNNKIQNELKVKLLLNLLEIIFNR